MAYNIKSYYLTSPANPENYSFVVFVQKSMKQTKYSTKQIEERKIFRFTEFFFIKNLSAAARGLPFLKIKQTTICQIRLTLDKNQAKTQLRSGLL